jgi:Adenosylmethionine decarboxylase
VCVCVCVVLVWRPPSACSKHFAPACYAPRRPPTPCLTWLPACRALAPPLSLPGTTACWHFAHASAHLRRLCCHRLRRRRRPCCCVLLSLLSVATAGFFEGPEKTLEVCFKPGIGHPAGCRALSREQLDQICKRARCTILCEFKFT